ADLCGIPLGRVQPSRRLCAAAPRRRRTRVARAVPGWRRLDRSRYRRRAQPRPPRDASRRGPPAPARRDGAADPAAARSATAATATAALDMLAEAGFSRTYGETREAFAKRVVARVPSFEQVTAMHMAARLGDPNADPARREEFSVETWRRLLKTFRTELPSVAPRWRRLLGLLHPASFFDAR